LIKSGLLSVLHERPSFLTIMTWIDYNTLSLLFGMMVIVGLLRDTGFFEFAAVKAYKIAEGNFWKCAHSPSPFSRNLIYIY
jgi:Na+/H+ antiporter NhaD/arsenite permease-like protein